MSGARALEATPDAAPDAPADGGLALHPEAVDGQTATLRWVTRAADALGFVGVPAAVPAPLADLLAGAGTPAAGTPVPAAPGAVLSGVVVEPGAVLTTLATGRTWRAEGATVRTALARSLARPAAWTAPAGVGDDDVLAAVVEQVLAGEVGEYVRSHGGRITLVRAAGGAVEVALSGACTHCPAAGLTLDGRVEAAVRARHPALVSLTATTTAPAAPAPAAGGRRRLSLLPLRRG